jgi:Family of unknown function (DUF6152)
MRYVGVLCCVVAVVLVGAYAMPAAAHHSFAAEFDGAKVVTMTGKVSKVEWTNPHAFFYVDVKDEKTNEVATWACELNSPNSLMRLGWTRDSMKVEDVITVTGSLAKDGSKLLNARTIVMANTGKRLFAGSSDGTPTR